MTDRFSAAEAVANATLYEGYVLYPYRASALKNQCRWQFGVLAPPAYVASDPSERSRIHTECILDAGAQPVDPMEPMEPVVPMVQARVRLLQVQRRTVRAASLTGTMSEVESLSTRDGDIVPWDEAVESVIDLPVLSVPPWGEALTSVPVRVDASMVTHPVAGPDGKLVGEIVRVRRPLSGLVRLQTQWADEPRRLLKVAVAVENTTPWSLAAEPDTRRDEMVREALVAVHTMLAVKGGAFVSSLEPPPFARAAVRSCRNEGSFPVLIAAGDGPDLVLSSPIIMYDHPAVAPESQGDLYDATEIDEILALRVLTLSPMEKAEARALDPRAAAIVDRCESMTPDVWAMLHGTIRALRPPGDVQPETGRGDSHSDTVDIDGVDIGPGAKVVLRPSHLADAQDLFLAGQTATVTGVFHDVNDEDLLIAVTVDEDPAAELLLWHGRYLYFHPDEVEPIDHGLVS